jgi:DNA-binding response OmpR family regulator
MASILFLDINDDAVREPIDLLQAAGHKTRFATSIAEAEAVLDSEKINVLVCGGILRDSDLGSVLQMITRRGLQHDVPVIVLTIVSAWGDVLRNWSLRIDSYIMRHGDPWQIVLGVEQVLNRKILPRHDGAA